MSKEESLFDCLFFMHLEPIQANGTKLCRAYSFLHRKAKDYFSIKNEGENEDTYAGHKDESEGGST